MSILHSIVFLSLFLFLCFFFGFWFYLKKYAFFRSRLYKLISALHCYISDIDKSLCANDESDISNTGPYPLFSDNFCPVCGSLVSADEELQKCGRKKTYLYMEKEKRMKSTKNRRCVNSPYDLRLLNFKKST